VTAPHASRRYFSRYLGKSVAKDDSSRKVPPLLSASMNLSIFHYENKLFKYERNLVKTHFVTYAVVYVSECQ
jgi:hypothetical protein